MENKPMPDAVDLGCGPNKVQDTFGVDCHHYKGVDKVFDLDEKNWPLENDSFTKIYSRHVIEHVSDIKNFMNEIHRIAKDGAIVEITTPHFSSIHSWQDPTHRWHLASKWYKPFTDQYLSEQVYAFKHISTDVLFSMGSLRSIIPRLMIKIFGVSSWEKHYAFIFRARNIKTVLKVLKI